MSFAGELGLWVGLLMAGWGALASFAGQHWRRLDLQDSGARGLYATSVLLAVAIVGLFGALLRQDFSLTIVAATTGLDLPWPYRIAALWSTPSGATLCLALATAVPVALVLRSLRARRDPVAVRFAGAASLLLLFLMLLIRAGADPYDILPVPPVDGAGMHPSLQRPGMLLHPPLLAMAVGLAAVPCVLALCCIAAGHVSARSRFHMRRSAAIGWGILTLAIVAGMWWTHVTRTAGRSWPLDPVVHGTVFPWLLLGAFCAWGGRTRTGRWASTLLVLPVAALLVAMALVLATQLGLTLAPFERLASPVGLVIGALILVGTGATVALARERLGAQPAEERGDTSSADSDVVTSSIVRSQRARQLAAGIAVVGAVLLGAAIAGHLARATSTIDLRPGDSAVRTDPFGREWRIVHEGTSVFPQANRRVLAVGLGLFRDARRAGTIAPQLREYVTAQGEPTHEPASVPAVRSRPGVDVVASIAERSAERVRIRIDFEPFALWAWIGGVLLAAGGTIYVWPRRGVDA